MNKRFFKALVLLITVLLLSSCANQKESELIESVEQLNGKDLGCMSGSIFDQLIKEKFPDSNIIYFNSRSELLLALTTGKIEGFVSDEPVAMMMISQNDNVNYLDEAVGNVERAARQSFFQVSSIITTTGFSTVDFNQWSSLAKMILVTLMFCGACAGSTGGGLKVSRIVILLKSIHKEIRSYMHPKCVKKIKVDGEVLDHDVLRATNVFLVTYFLIFVASLFIVCLDDKDLITSFTAVAATMNNIGPGLEKVGPAANFSEFSNLSKMVLSFDMLAGRLELFPMIMLFHPILWRDTIIAKIRHHSKAA